MPPTAQPVVPARPAIQVIERMNALLDTLARQSAPVSRKDLSGQTGLHPSTAHRI
ncbi:MAG: helix-turn-helix domain-containing protein, partial [Burkholderiaceae bacterium]